MRPRLGIDVDAPAERAWEQLVDVRCWPRWGPTVRGARLDDGTQLLSAGATGEVQTSLGVWLRFRIEDWRAGDAVRAWSWRVAGAPATEHVVLARGPSRCRVEMSVPWWGAPYLGVVAVALLRIRRLTAT
ncbi:SRPBCC family protein [Nocardioides ochotonae]|uniref:SRPBCC family protein n=1 Tax=Nocardioides ochotonae TaxID=2685869 RepID=UPI0014093B66|nr:SRPBCC family protein [Nocardioides ochotonae]